MERTLSSCYDAITLQFGMVHAMTDRENVRRLAAIVAIDVAGYSRLMGTDEEGTLSALKTHRRELIDQRIEAFNGRIVKTTGDGLLLEFSSVVDAARCSLDVQQAMLARNDAIPVERRIQFRIGINLGDVIIDGDDIFGNGVNIAARLETIADPGGICISQAVLDQVKQKLTLDFEDLGNMALKNIEEPVRTYRISPSQQNEKIAKTSATNSSIDAVLPLPKRPSIAIMPFRNLNGDKQIDYIADGIGLGIQTLLVQLSGLFFVNASAHRAYRDGEVSAAEAVADFPVRYVLEGAVQYSDQQVRVTIQLTDIHDSAVIWADRYDRDLEDVFVLQDDITREVIRSLGIELHYGDRDRIWLQGLTTKNAWRYFLRGISHMYKFTKHDNAIALEMFEKIYHLHPDKMIGPSYLAMTHWLDSTRGWTDSPTASMQQACDWAERSIQTEDGNNGLGYAILGSIRLKEGQHEEALALCRKAVAFRSTCPLALGQLANVQLHCGDSHGAVKNAREALAVRGIYPPVMINVLATAYRDSGEVDMSISAASESARLDPDHTDAFVILCCDYVLAGLDTEAHRVADQITEINPEFRISEYAKNLPYRDSAKVHSIIETLRAAGLPD